jgi:hypothetical protein
MPRDESAVVAPEPTDTPPPDWQPTPVPVDWLWNVLTVGGPSERVELFQRGEVERPGDHA